MSLSANQLAKLHQAVNPAWYLDYREYLQACYLYLKQEVPGTSYVSFSENLGFSKTNVLFLIIKGKRPLSNKAAEKIIAGLELTGVEKQYFRTLVHHANASTLAEKDELFRKLVTVKSQSVTSPMTRSQLDFFNEWYHVAIYELINAVDFQSNSQWIAKHLQPNIRPEQARKSLQLLQSLDLIVWDAEKKRFLPTKTRVSTGDEIASVAVIRYHQQLLDLAKNSLTTMNEHERDISAISFAVPSYMIEEIKEEIRIFRKKILSLTEQERRPDTVYQMAIQLFPVTKTKPSNT